MGRELAIKLGSMTSLESDDSGSHVALVLSCEVSALTRLLLTFGTLCVDQNF